jgi:hypothetical protein
MAKVKEISLFITLFIWATLIGAVTYSHVVFFSTYLHHLPESTSLLSGPYGLHEERFWMAIHPVLILSILITLILNWKLSSRRKYILINLSLYIITLAVTFTFFVPELKAFAQSKLSGIPASEWLERGKRWEHLSWIRGFFMYVGFLLLLIALLKNRTQHES